MPHYVIPQHIFIGKNALEEASPYIKECGRNPLIVTGKHVGKSPMYEKLTRILEQEGITYQTFDGIIGEPTNKMIDEGLSLYRESGCDFMIGIGGGSPLDSAKAIAAMAVKPGKIADYMGKEITGEIPPVVAIPTTAGTGSEATKFTIITDQEKDIKMLLKGDCLIPKLAIIDPDFSMDMPKSVSAATGLDAFTHAVEAYTSKKAFPLTDTLAVSAVKRILKYLPVVYQNGYDTKAREEMTIAALEAGICINNSSVTIVHGMSRPVGALFHVPHGLSNAMLLKECIGFALDGTYERFADLGRASGVADETDSDQTAAEKFMNQVGELCSICEVPTLEEYGIEKETYFAAIDKMASDYKGDPTSAMLEVLDPEQNKLFSDNYLEEPYDLSQVMFVATGNYLGDIPEALRDRLEIINLSSYTEEEKLNIAKRHLIPKQIKANGLKKSQFKISDANLRYLIRHYTREAGVRQLERTISSLARKTVLAVLKDGKESVTINKEIITEWLGQVIFEYGQKEKRDQVGVVTGLAFTQFGGDVLPIEVTTFEGKGRLIVTGQLGDVMKESAEIAFGYVKSHAKEFKITPDFFEKHDVQVHVPEGAVPKDGPSAGVTFTTALISALTNRKVAADIAMTGEITLRGNVLPIGGLKEKSLAAHRVGIKRIVIPKMNEKDLVDVPEVVRESVNFIPVETIDQVLKEALVQ